MLRLTLLTSLIIGALALTPDELDAFKPRVAGYVDPNTNKTSVIYAIDNHDGSQLIYTNSIPSHETWIFPDAESGNPNELLEVAVNMNINSVPVMRAEPLRCLPLGYVGIATSGTPIFSWYPAAEGCLDVKLFEELDICEGHPSPDNIYHYHYFSPCVQMPVCEEPSPIYGVAIDGFPIYGPIGEDGVQLTAADLDECGGKFDREGRYKYHVTGDPQYFMNCLKGEIRSDSGKEEDDFYCLCPYDDRLFIKSDEKMTFETVCNVSSIGSELITCSDKEYLSTLEYDIGFEWTFQDTNVTLLACCPKGEDCGTSCKTEDGTKDVCVEETKVISYLTREFKDYSQTNSSTQTESPTEPKTKPQTKPHPDFKPMPRPRRE